MAPSGDETAFLDEVWSQQSRWSRTANRMKQRIGRARLASLIVAVAMAVSGTLAGALSDSRPTLARILAALVALGTVALLQLRPRWSGEALQSWTRARSVSEGLKQEVYLFLAGVGDYAERTTALARLRGNIDDIEVKGADLLSEQEGIEPAQRALPKVHDPVSYFDLRVTDQITGYYDERAVELKTTLRRFNRVETALTLLSGALAVLAAAVGTGLLAPWIAVTTTVGTAVAVHVAATRYAFQRIEYLRTAAELRKLRTEASADGTTDERRVELVLEAEQVISAENKAWMAKLAEEPPAQTGGAKAA